MATATKKTLSLNEKLFGIQSEAITLTKDTKGYNYKYFDINKMLKALRPVLEAYKLLLTQPIVDGNVVSRITCIESGDYVESFLPITIGAKPQDMGSEVTYMRRYTLQSLLALEAEDDDGERASAPKPQLSGEKLAKAVEAVKQKRTTIDAIKRQYTLTADAESQLRNASN